MFGRDEFRNAISSAAAQLRTVERTLSALACPVIRQLTINLSDLSQERIEELLEEVPSGHSKEDSGADFVYIIQTQNDDAGKIAQLSTLLENARKTDSDYSRINPEHNGTTTLYVGRSKTLRGRLHQHLGAENRNVYSLHLQRWATSVELDIEIYNLRFSNTDDLLVQAVEDAIWASLKPAFGRKGGR